MKLQKDLYVHYVELYRHLSDGILILDEEHCVTYANPAAVEMLGNAPQVLFNTYFFDIIADLNPYDWDSLMEDNSNPVIPLRFVISPSRLEVFLNCRRISPRSDELPEPTILLLKKSSHTISPTLAINSHEKELSWLWQQAPSGNIILNAEYQVLQINRQAQIQLRNLFGIHIQKGDFLTAGLFSRIFFQKKLQKCLAGEPLVWDECCTLSNQKKQWVCFWGTQVNLPGHTQASIWLQIHDVDHRKKVETNLRQNEYLYRTIVKSFPNTQVSILNRDYQVIFTEGNIQNQYISGIKDYLQLLIDHDLEHIDLKKFEMILWRTFNGESCCYDLSPTDRSQQVYTRPLYDEAGQIEHILLIAQDNSEFKAYENKLKELNEKLVRQNDELKRNQENFVFANQKLSSQQFKLEDLLDKFKMLNERLLEQNNELASQEEQLAQANEQLLTQQRALQEANQRLILQNQTLAQHEEDLLNANQQLRLQQEELKAAMKELSDRNFELDQIVYRTSHDIRSPLTSMLGLISLINLEEVPEYLREYIDQIENSIRKLDNFVRDMLNFAKTNRTHPKAEVIDFDQLIGKCFEQIKYLPHFDQIQKDIICSGNPEKFRSDSFRLDVVFSNIISNAVKYMNPLREDPFLKIDIALDDAGAQIVFRDNGIGISQNYLNRVFEMFFRATDKAKGSGLGLYIVKQTIEKLGGTIQISSEYGEGTEISIYLPSLS